MTRILIAAGTGLFAFAAAAHAGPIITGVTYAYDLSMADPGTGILTTFHDAATSQDPDLTKLTDGEPGSEVGVGEPPTLFTNGTWVGVQNGGFGGAPQPKVDFDLGGTFILESVEVTYLVEDPSFIYAPQPIPDGAGGNLFDAITVFTSTDGVSFDPAGASNDFNPIFGEGGDSGTGVRERRSVLVDLGGVQASHLNIDVRTPFTFIFLGEVTIRQVPEPASLGLLGIGALTLLARRRRAA